MIGSELAPYPGYLLNRAATELAVRPRVSARQMSLAGAFVRLFGVPELGVQLRIAHVLRRLPADVGAVADLGCGAGMLLGAIARRRRFSRLAGFEIDAESAAIARASHPMAEIHACRVEDAPAAFDGTFDTAICIDVLEHVPDGELDAFVGRAFALLRPGGTLAVHVPNVEQRRHFAQFREWGHHDHEREGFSPAQLAALLERNGFETVSCESTMGAVTSLSWELNMMVAGRIWQAALFPLTLAICSLAERRPVHDGNGVLAVARKPASAAV